MPLPQNTALILVDIQQGLDHPTYYGDERNNPQAEENIASLLTTWRTHHLPIFHIQHHSTTPESPLHPSNAGVEFKPEALPQGDEPILTKHVNSAFIGTDLDQRLKDAGIDTLVICGLTTQHCVSTTTRMAGNFGFNVYLSSDATAAFSATGYNGQSFSAQQVHDVELANLHGEFATVLPTDEIINMLE